MPALSVRGLTLARARAELVQDISFSAEAGAITAILGASGAGKTTLLAGLAGLIKPLRGSVLVGGVDVTGKRGRRRGIGMLEPGADLGAARSVTAALRRVAPRGAALLPALAAVGCDMLAARTVGSLSHAEGLAVLAAARVLAGADAPVQLLDEVGMGLEAAQCDAMWALLEQGARAGRALVLATRSASVALRADHVVLLHGRTVLQAGAADAVYAEPRDVAAARLTGPANILTGIVRQKVPGGIIWVAGGARFQQAVGTQPMPALAGPVALCLRPHAVLLGPPGAPLAPGANNVPGVVIRPPSPGGAFAWVETGLGVLQAASPAVALAAGAPVQLSWAHNAASLLLPPVA